MRIVERAEVVAIEGGRARLAIRTPEDAGRCGSCPASSSCGSGGRARELEAPVPSGMEPVPSPGDEVTVEIEGPSPALAAFLLFIVPLAAAFATGAAAYGAVGSETAAVAAGMLGAGAVWLGLYLARGRFRWRASIVIPNRPENESPGDR